VGGKKENGLGVNSNYAKGGNVEKGECESVLGGEKGKESQCGRDDRGAKKRKGGEKEGYH